MSLKERFSRVKVLVVGDVMLDRYHWGTVTRVSPEAPVPVVAHESTTLAAGGAANVAVNVAGLGAQPFLIGIMGDDDEATMLPDVLAASGISEAALFSFPGRKTTVKTRIVAHNQQIVRLDQETITELSPDEYSLVIGKLKEVIETIDVVLLSDYGKGFLTPPLLATLIATAKEQGRKVLVDPKGKDYSKYAGASLLTPNLRETAEACNLELHSGRLIETARDRLLHGLGLDALLITQGEHGMTILENGLAPVQLEATARNVYDVTGAGDTAIAALAVALGSGMELPMAARIANAAAGLVVERIGTTPVTAEDLALVESELTGGS